jgi:hypothetical protein
MNRVKLTRDEGLRILGLAESMCNIGVSRTRVLQVLEVTEHTLEHLATQYGALPVSAEERNSRRAPSPGAQPKRRDVRQLRR